MAEKPPSPEHPYDDVAHGVSLFLEMSALDTEVAAACDAVDRLPTTSATYADEAMQLVTRLMELGRTRLFLAMEIAELYTAVERSLPDWGHIGRMRKESGRDADHGRQCYDRMVALVADLVRANTGTDGRPDAVELRQIVSQINASARKWIRRA
jgi:hypothetical protein